MSHEQIETERTYDVPHAASLPALAGGPVARVVVAPTLHLTATYLDTDRLALARSRTTLRRREGGDDDGWHLKQPLGGDRRREVHSPLGAPDDVPSDLRLRVAALARGRDLRPVVRLTTRRDQLQLLDADDVVLAVVCDDHVDAERLDGDRVLSTSGWREWEVELVEGGPGVLKSVGRRFAAAGVHRSAHPSKLARALGDDLPAAPSADRPGPDASAAEVLRDRLRRDVAELVRTDALVRADEPEAVHDARVAARRLRSLLATWRPVLDRVRTEPVRDELRWFGRVLGAARDAEVLRARLGAAVATQPGELVLGPVAVRVDDELSVRYRQAHAAAVEAMDSPRYAALLDSLDALVDDLPVTSPADRRATEVVPRLLHRDWRRLRRAADAALESGAPPEALHDARKAAKRLKYACAPAVALHGKPAKRLRRTAKDVQTVLGQRQDAVDAAAELRALGVQAHLAGENGFTFGRLHALEEGRRRAAEREFAALWRDVPRVRPRRWSH